MIAPDPATGGAATDGSTKTTFAHDFDGNEIASTGPDLNTTFNTFDDLNHEVQQTGPPPAGGLPAPVTTWQLDAEGELLREVDPLGRAQTNQFDGMGRVVDSVSFAGVEQQFGYDVLSNLTSQSLVGVGLPTETTTHGYDALSREVLTTAPDGGQTATGYDLANNIVSLVDPAGNSTTWQVDGLDRVVTDTNAGGTRTFGYDLAGDVTSEVDRDGRLRTFQYDTLGQQTAENWLASSAQATATATFVTAGSGGYTNTVQNVVLPPETDGGTFTLSLDGQTTAPLAWNAWGGDVQNALAALPAVGAGNATVWGDGTSAEPYLVTFGGALAGQNVPALTAQASLTYSNPASVAETAQGQPVQDAVDTVHFTGQQGDLIELGRATPDTQHGTWITEWVAIPYGADAATIQSRIGGGMFPNIISVTGTWPDFTVTFDGLVDPDATSLSRYNDVLAGNFATITPQASGYDGQNEVQAVQFQPVVGGTFTLSFNGQTTAPLAYSAAARRRIQTSILCRG